MLDRRDEYEKMAAAEPRLWWYRALHAMVIRKLRQYGAAPSDLIVDAGCGTGGLMMRLREAGFSNVSGFDLSPYAVEFCQFRNIGIASENVLNCARLYPPASAQALICNDILYFLGPAQQRTALDQFARILAPGGVALINLPALKAFAGTHDLAVGISHRFSKRGLQDMLEMSSFTLAEAVYWPFLLSPAIYAARCIQRLSLRLSPPPTRISSDVRMPPALINNVLFFIADTENKLLSRKPFGSSLFLVLRKLPGQSR
ncbi:MAG: class I SAM-dependent methyltransferase [bacterium]